MKVLLLAIGDRYWTRFIREYSDLLIREGFDVINVLESRIGEYQLYGERQNYENSTTYYLTDYVKIHNSNDRSSSSNEVSASLNSTGNRLGVFSDYLRLQMLDSLEVIRDFDYVNYDALLFNFYQYIFNKHPDINVVLHDQVSTGFSYACWEAASSRGIPYIGLAGGRISGRIEIKSCPYTESEKVKALFDGIQAGNIIPLDKDRSDAIQYITEIESSTPDYMRLSPVNNPSLKNVFPKEKIFNMLGLLKYFFLDGESRFLRFIHRFPIRDAIRSTLRNFVRLCRIKYLPPKLDDLPENFTNLQYFVYPIHFQPEATSCVESQYYSDQLQLIRNIAFSLPRNVYLIVKEHRTNYCYPNSSFYARIKSFPNVILVSPYLNIKSIIRHSLGLITLNSTAGLEALVMGKRVIALGHVFYTFHKNCLVVDGWIQLKKIINKLTLENKITNDDENGMDYQYNINFICAYFYSTLRGVIDFESPHFNIKNELIDKLKTF